MHDGRMKSAFQKVMEDIKDAAAETDSFLQPSVKLIINCLPPEMIRTVVMTCANIIMTTFNEMWHSK